MEETDWVVVSLKPDRIVRARKSSNDWINVEIVSMRPNKEMQMHRFGLTMEEYASIAKVLG